MISGRHSSDHLPAELIRSARVIFDRLSPDGAPISYHHLVIGWPEYQRRLSNEWERFPVTFLHCLRRVTPANDMLTFERFCAGLRLAVAEERQNQNFKPCAFVEHPDPPSSDADNAEKSKQLMAIYGSMIIQPTNPPPYNVALSRSKMNLDAIHRQTDQAIRFDSESNAVARSTPQICEKSSNGFDSERLNQFAAQAKMANHAVQPKNGHHASRPSSVQSTETNGSLEGIKFRDKSAGGNQAQSRTQQPRAVTRDTRRHTIIEGSESSMTQSKHARLMQEEKQLLIKASDTATKLHNWYNQRLSNLETREKLIGKSMIPVDFAVHEEKLNYLRAHITELNRRAVALMESSEKGFPWHMNLQLHRNIPQPTDDRSMWLKRQNKMLTNEVAEKSERIAQLETENARLMKRFCESPQHKLPSQNSTALVNGAVCRNSSSGGTDSGFHSLTHHSPPFVPTNGHVTHTYINGIHNQHPSHPSQPIQVYATPVISESKYERPVVPRDVRKLITERQADGILATFM